MEKISKRSQKSCVAILCDAKDFSHKKATFYTVLHERLKVEGFCASKLEFFYSESVDILGPYKLFIRPKSQNYLSPLDDLIFE